MDGGIAFTMQLLLKSGYGEIHMLTFVIFEGPHDMFR